MHDSWMLTTVWGSLREWRVVGRGEQRGKIGTTEIAETMKYN